MFHFCSRFAMFFFFQGLSLQVLLQTVHLLFKCILLMFLKPSATFFFMARLLELPDSFLANRHPKSSLDLGLPPLPACSSGFIQSLHRQLRTHWAGSGQVAEQSRLSGLGSPTDTLPSWLYSVHRLNWYHRPCCTHDRVTGESQWCRCRTLVQ